MAKQSSEERTIATNRRAYHDYHVEDKWEAGILLTGTEVKSLRAARITFKDSYVAIENQEMWLFHCHIEEYLHGNRFNHDPERPRKLLLHAHEIRRCAQAVEQRGYTLIPLRFYFKGPWVKVEIGLCRGKKHYDQRQDISEREARRDIERALKRDHR